MTDSQSSPIQPQESTSDEWTSPRRRAVLVAELRHRAERAASDASDARDDILKDFYEGQEVAFRESARLLEELG